MGAVYAQTNVGTGSGSFANVYKTSDQLTWGLFRGDDGSNSGVFYFWIDEFNSNNNAVFTNNAGGKGNYTLNNGGTWTAVVNAPPNGALLVGCLPDGTLIAASCANFAQYTMYQSTNGGSTWSTILLPSQSSKMLMINGGTSGRETGFWRASNGALFVAGADTTNGVFMVWKSVDEGASWQRVLNQSTSNLVYSFQYKRTAAGKDIILYGYNISGSAGIGVFRSENLGATWSSVTVDNAKHGSFSGGQFANASVPDLTCNPGYMNNGTWLLFASYVNDGFGDTTPIYFRSNSDGASWVVDPSVNLGSNGLTSGLLWSDTTSGSWFSISGNHVYKATDGGDTWTQFSGAPWNTTVMKRMWSNPAAPTSIAAYRPRPASPIAIASPRLKQVTAAYAPYIRVYN